MSVALYPHLQAAHRDGHLAWADIEHAVAACAEGYAFPTNLDRDPPLGGLAPASPQAVMLRALEEGWAAARFEAQLARMAGQRRTD